MDEFPLHIRQTVVNESWFFFTIHIHFFFLLLFGVMSLGKKFRIRVIICKMQGGLYRIYVLHKIPNFFQVPFAICKCLPVSSSLLLFFLLIIFFSILLCHWLSLFVIISITYYLFSPVSHFRNNCNRSDYSISSDINEHIIIFIIVAFGINFIMSFTITGKGISIINDFNLSLSISICIDISVSISMNISIGISIGILYLDSTKHYY